jgi:flagellar hook-length control protein FliK
VALTLQELLNWPPEIGDLGKAAHDVATNHADSAEFLRSAMQASDWDGESGDTARQAVFSTAADHDKQAERIKAAATLIDTAHQEADALANKVKDILNFAAEAPAVNVEITTGEVSQPASYDYMDAETQTKVSEKIAEVKALIADAIIEGDKIDDELAKAIAKASGLPEPAPTPMTTPDLGPLQVVLRVADNHAHALFVSQHQQVREAVEAALPKLREAMEAGGIGLGSASVSDGFARQSGQQAQQNGQGSSGSSRGNGGVTATAGIDDGSVSGAATATVRRTVGMVDTFV